MHIQSIRQSEREETESKRAVWSQGYFSFFHSSQSVRLRRFFEHPAGCMSSLSFSSLHRSLPHHLSSLSFSFPFSLLLSLLPPTFSYSPSLSLSLHTKAEGSQQRLNLASISQSTSCSNVSVALSPLLLCRQVSPASERTL